MLGKDQPVILQLLELPQALKALNGVVRGGAPIKTAPARPRTNNLHLVWGDMCVGHGVE